LGASILTAESKILTAKDAKGLAKNAEKEVAFLLGELGASSAISAVKVFFVRQSPSDWGLSAQLKQGNGT
jgi:hypothetical protein